MDIDWTLVNKANNLAETQLDRPILDFPIVPDYRQPLVEFLRPEMKILDVGSHDRSLGTYLDSLFPSALEYSSMDIDRSQKHDFYSLEKITGQFDAVVCFEVVEHMTPRMALDFFSAAYKCIAPKGRLFVSTPNVYHPMAFWSDCTHITPFRIRHLAGWMGTAGFSRFWGYRVVQMNWKKRLRYWRYRGLLRLLNLDFAPGIVVVAEK